jgi:hypothetical protein
MYLLWRPKLLLRAVLPMSIVMPIVAALIILVPLRMSALRTPCLSLLLSCPDAATTQLNRQQALRCRPTASVSGYPHKIGRARR